MNEYHLIASNDHFAYMSSNRTPSFKTTGKLESDRLASDRHFDSTTMKLRFANRHGRLTACMDMIANYEMPVDMWFDVEYWPHAITRMASGGVVVFDEANPGVTGSNVEDQTEEVVFGIHRKSRYSLN